MLFALWFYVDRLLIGYAVKKYLPKYIISADHPNGQWMSAMSWLSCSDLNNRFRFSTSVIYDAFFSTVINVY